MGEAGEGRNITHQQKKLNEEELEKNIAEAVNEANKNLSQIEKIRKYIVVSEPFSTDNGMFTATMKIRRHKVREAYGETLDALYKNNQ